MNETIQMKLPFHMNGAFCCLPGYVAFNGHVFTKHECDTYNKYTNEIIAERYPAAIDFLFDQRHRMFLLIISPKNEMEQEYLPQCTNDMHADFFYC